MRSRLTSSHFVGRAGELAELEQAFDEAASGRPGLVLVGGDSGPTHLAAALGIPLVALYGPTDPARNGPWGPGPTRVMRGAGSITSHKRVAEIDAGLARIGVEDVMREVKAVVG